MLGRQRKNSTNRWVGKEREGCILGRLGEREKEVYSIFLDFIFSGSILISVFFNFDFRLILIHIKFLFLIISFFLPSLYTVLYR